MANKFNDKEHISSLDKLPNIYIPFTQGMLLPRYSFSMTPIFIKSFNLKSKPRLNHVITNHKLSSNRAMQRDDYALD